MLYYCFIYARIQYGSVIWGNAPKIYLKESSVRLNGIIHTITFSKKYSHVTNKSLQELNLLKLNNIYKLELAKYIYQLHYGTLLKSFYDRFIKLSAIHNYSTRQKQNLVYFRPQIKKTIGRELLTHIITYAKKLNPPLKILDGFLLKHNTKNFLLKITIPLRIKSLSITYNDVLTL